MIVIGILQSRLKVTFQLSPLSRVYSTSQKSGHTGYNFFFFYFTIFGVVEQ